MAGPNLPIAPLNQFSERDAAIQERQEAESAARIEGRGLEIFSMAVERENYLSRKVNTVMREQGISLFPDENWSFRTGKTTPPPEFAADPNYRHEEDEKNYGYDPYVMSFASSAEEANQMRTQIKMEQQQMRLISESAAGAWGTGFGGVFQPHTAASLAFAPVSLPLAIGVEMALESGSEMLNHQDQLTRTFQESAFQVAFTGVGVGIVGGASIYLSKSTKTADTLIDDINDGVYDGMLEIEGRLDKVEEAQLSQSGGAMRAGSDITAEEDQLATVLGSSRLARWLSIGQIPSLVNSPSKVSRWVGQKMGNNPLFTEANKVGKTHGVTAEAFNESALGKTVIATEKTIPMQRASGMKVEEFEEAVGVAMSNGDRATNPEVQRAAEMYRKEVVIPIREAAERVGLLESSESLNLKIGDIDAKIQEIINTGQAGPGSKALKQSIEADKAKIEAKADKTTVRLQKKVDALAARLEKARKPLADGKARTAPVDLIKKHNEAKSELTAHKKSIEDSVKTHTAKLNLMKRQGDELKALRKEKRDLQKKLATGGTSFAESYFPRIYNREKILENWNGLQKKIRESFEADEAMMKMYGPQGIDDMVDDTMSNMMIGRYQNMTVKGVPSPARARSLALWDNELEEYLEKNAGRAMIRYTQSMQPQIMFREAFENKTLLDLFEEIKADYRVLNADENLSAKARDKLIKQEKADRENLQVMYNRLTDQVQRSIQPNSTIDKILQGSKVGSTAALLGEIVLTSTPDLARPISHYGMRSFQHGVAAMNKQFLEGVGSQLDIQVKRLGAAMQRTLNSRANQFSDSLEPMGGMTQKVQQAWSKWSGFDMYTDVVESIAAHAAMDFVLRAAKKVGGKAALTDAEKLAVSRGEMEMPVMRGALSQEETMQISRMGLDEEDLVGILRESMGTKGADDPDLMYMNTMAWKDTNLAQRVEAGIGSDIKRTIIQAGIGDKPAGMDRTTLSWLFQFQTFTMQAQNKILVAGLQNAGKHTAEGMVTMVALGASVAGIKAHIRGDDVSKWSAEKWVLEGIDRSGMSGAMRTPLNVLRYVAATNGLIDEAPSRYVGREIEGFGIAPTVGVVGNVIRGIGNVSTGEIAKGSDQILKAVPFNNLLGVRNVLMTLGDN